MQTLYEVLGVSSGATDEEIHHAYKVKAQLLHPDHHSGAPDEVVKLAQEEMTALNQAYQTLRDPHERRQYDASLQTPSAQDSAHHSRATTRRHTVRQPGVGECRFCGSTPVADVVLKAQTGKVIFRSLYTVHAPLCRDCALATGRSMTNRTLWLGWWGAISALTTPFYVGKNLIEMHKAKRLEAPSPTPGVAGAFPQPMPIGKPLVGRSGPWFAAAAIAVVVSVAAGSSNSSQTPASSSTDTATTIDPQLVSNVCTSLKSESVSQYASNLYASNSGYTVQQYEAAINEVAGQGCPTELQGNQ
ncbi:MAG TPA: J domain-containing protein [Acidimicrobiales bacterium]|nr:J domain-containing protein [Acidimicrobiales bacterium]